MSVVYEPARIGDAGAIGAILTSWIDEVDWMPRVHGPSQYLGYGQMLIGRTDVTVARQSDDVAGFLGRQGDDIQALYIGRRFRGQGLGAGLLWRAKSDADRLQLWTFQANTGARRFYERHGFVQEQVTDGQGNDEKLPDVHLSWNGDQA